MSDENIDFEAAQELNNEINKELQIKNKEKKSDFDLNDQNELDYEEDDEHGENINVSFFFSVNTQYRIALMLYSIRNRTSMLN